MCFRYLEVEWEVRKGTQRSFGKDVMKGSSPRVPQQDNFSDCGVYILQYVESFFEVRTVSGCWSRRPWRKELDAVANPLQLCLKQNPIPSFHLPIQLSDWFPQQRMKTKRNEIKELILKIQQHQELDRKQPEQALPGSSSEAEIQ